MRNPVIGWVSSEWAPVRRNPATGVVSSHAGIDIAANVGTPVVAAFAGVVVSVRTGSYGGDPVLWRGAKSGNHVLVKNSDGEHQYYGHLDRVDVRVGEWVSEGEQLGTCGQTGRVTGPHLHFECWRNSSMNSHANPREWFKAHGVTPGVETITAAASTTVTPTTEGDLTMSERKELEAKIDGLASQVESLRGSVQSGHIEFQSSNGKTGATNVTGALGMIMTLLRRILAHLEKEN